MIENRINEVFPETNYDYNEVIKAARYSLILGGKRIRPLIMLQFCKLCGGKTEDVLDFAIALEMIHTYSLIHDDLPCMDDDDFRRGNPSCHKKFGEDIALLAGDTLLTKAFSVAVKSNTSAEIKASVISCLADYAGEHGMIGGQVLDLSFEKSTPDAESLKKMYSMKTGGLLKAAAEIGCIAANADIKHIEKAREYAENVGLAFQIIDDILDVTADPVGSDEKNNKTTFVSLFGLEDAKNKAKALTKNALNSLEFFENDSSALKEITNYLLDRKF